MKNKIVNVKNEFKFKYFPDIKGIDRTKIMITTEGVYSISDNDGSNKLVYLISKYFKNDNNIVITDATGNNGSDTIALGLKFKKINSIELDPVNFEALTNNVKNVYKLDNVNLFHGNSLDFIDKLKQDIVYIDAPWGGVDYKKNDRMELFLNNKNMGQIYNEYKSHAKLFIFKLPKNYDFTNFIQTTMVTKYYIYLYTKNDKPKFFLLFVPV